MGEDIYLLIIIKYLLLYFEIYIKCFFLDFNMENN